MFEFVGTMNQAKRAAYTGPREDLFAMVPQGATSILDVGCSNGALGGSLRAAVPGRKVVGIDGNLVLINEAAAKLDRVIHTDLNQFNWSKEFAGMLFDCIVFGDILEHLLDPHRQLAEARRCLTSDGCIVISLPNVRHISSLYSIFICGTFPQRNRGIFDRTHLHWFTLHDAQVLIKNAGLKIEKTSYNLRLGDHGGGRLNYMARRVLDPISAFAPIREFLTYQFCVRAISA